jgi:hypothetical protein
MGGDDGMAVDDERRGLFDQDKSLDMLGPGAFQLYGHGVLNSIASRAPGFVSDDYLDAFEVDTTTTAAELEAAGVWERRPGGFVVVADDMAQSAHESP